MLPTLLTRESIESLLYYAQRTRGAIVEVGVYQGGSAWHLALLRRPLFLYDTFTGLPCQGPLDGNELGKFADTDIETIRKAIPDATIVKGLFPDSLVPMPLVGFVHADADQYESTKAILRDMPPRMHTGGLILLDDYRVPGCEGCTEAVHESGLPVAIIRGTHKGLIVV